MCHLRDQGLVSREYATLERLQMRRLDRTGWLSGGDDPWLLALAAIAEKHPRRVLDAGCGAGAFATLIAAPEVTCIDSSPAAVAEAEERGLHALVADIQQLPFADGRSTWPSPTGCSTTCPTGRGRSRSCRGC